MASSFTQLRDIEERFFECSFCLQTLKAPKTLPCLHRYCRECLEKIIAKKKDAFNCPLCDEECDVPPEGVDAFKTDFLIKSVLEFCQLENTYKENNIKRCRGCKEVKNVICYCFRCRDFLCQQCYQFHLDNDMVEEHRPHLLDLRTVDVRSLTLDKLTSLTEDPRCAVHVKRPAEMCCETCGNTPICVACVFGDHEGHKTHEVRNLAKSEGEKMKAMMTTLDTCKDKLYELPSRVTKVQKALEANVKKQLEVVRSKHRAASEKVLEEAEMEKRVLKKQRNEIIMRNREECKQVQEDMEEEMKELKKKYDKILQGKEQRCGREVEKVDMQTEIIDEMSSAKVKKYNQELQGYEEKVRASKVDCEENISIVADHATQTINRYENLTATAQTVQASHDEWTEAQCLPAITAAGEVLIDDARKEFGDLESLSETGVRDSMMFIEQETREVAPLAVHVPGHLPLTAQMLASVPPLEQEQMFGERLFSIIQQSHGDVAGKITGMLLVMDNAELLQMLECRGSLKAKINEALAVLAAAPTTRDEETQEVAPQAVHVPGHLPLTDQMLASVPPLEQKQMLGERLFSIIQQSHVDVAGKITGMLLEMDNAELLHMLKFRDSLEAKIREALPVLAVHQQKELLGQLGQ